MRNQTLIILAVIGVILSVATLCASFARVDNLSSRIKSWWTIVGVLGGAVLLGRTAVVLLFAAISFVALREFLAGSDIEAGDRRVVVTVFTVVLPVQYLLVAFHRSVWLDGFLPVVGLPLIWILITLTANRPGHLARTSQLVTGVLICVYGISFVPALMDSASRGLLMVFLLLVTQASDVLQYIWGKLAGRHKLAPTISPSKTVEGLLGGVVSASAVGASLHWMTPFSSMQAAAMALVVALAGFLGGLVMSAMKRDRGVKDWSQFIPGHGGMLDRVDSLCFSAPLFYHLLRMFFPTPHNNFG
jgi:phosphatidate cytidylyltransferase